MKENKDYYIINEDDYNYDIIYDNYRKSFLNYFLFIFFLILILLYAVEFKLFNADVGHNNHKLIENIPDINPVRSNGGYISSTYRSSNRPNHKGVDIVNRIGTPILATADGVVIYSKYNWSGYGKLIKIKHFNGYETRYAHLNRIYVKNGDRVKKGNVIGELGNTGKSTGPHLHYEIRYNNRPKNPLKYFKF